MAAKDLTRTDAEHAIDHTLRALAVLNHLAIAGMLHADQANPTNMQSVIDSFEAAERAVEALGDWALRLPAD